MNIPIGELSRRSRIKIPTIRYYESIGLIPRAPRSEGNRRFYDLAAVERLSFIRHARELGFDIEAIRDLLTLSEAPQSSCAEADGIVLRHLANVEQRIAQLELLRAELARMVHECAHDRMATCRAISILANHDECLADSHPAPVAHGHELMSAGAAPQRSARSGPARLQGGPR
ncbi:MerR family transcriptional regulator [Neotabrizicola sp. VNH66]|uniref:MerR family transcriptional regulator n=1 Tax=Neotabrizicola sp. VNH66 TaxID=3400918 RepID=UPI003C03C62D